jgi:hypothetical protein
MMPKQGLAAFGFALMLAACSGAQGSSVPVTAAPAALHSAGLRATAPHATNVTIIFMENRDYSLIVGNPNAPYINGTLIPQGALLTDYHAIGHPSEPNYLAMFSGSTHGVQGDPCPLTYHSANIASELATAGKTFDGYSESMPSNGYTGCYAGEYARKHSPWVNFTNVPHTENLVYHGFPKRPPNLTWITPNLCNDMHDCSTKHGDTWLSKNLPPILTWNAKNDGLLIVVFDEAAPDRNGSNQVFGLLIGPTVVPGSQNTQNITHYSTLKTVEDIFGVACIKNECSAPDITGIWR